MPTTRVFSTPPVVNPLAWCPTITTLCKSHPQLYSGWYFKIKRSFFLLSSDWHGCTRMLKRFSSVILISWKWDASGGNSMPWVTLWTPCALVLRRSQVSASDIPIQKYSQLKKKAKYYLCVTPHVLTHFSVCPDIVIPFYYMVCTTCHERVVCSDDAGQNICLVSCFCSGLHGCYFVNSQKTDPKTDYRDGSGAACIPGGEWSAAVHANTLMEKHVDGLAEIHIHIPVKFPWTSRRKTDLLWEKSCITEFLLLIAHI